MPDTALLPLEHPDLAELRLGRLARLRATLKSRELAGILLYDPVNLRYATDARNMAVWTLHNAARYAWIGAEGPVVVFDFHGCSHVCADLETVDEIRPAISWFFFGAGPACEARAKRWAREIAELVRQHGGGNRRLAIDHCDPLGLDALRAEGVSVVEGQEVMERTRAIKTSEEVKAMRHALAAADAGMRAMEENLVPGISENALWAWLHHENIARDGEWIETRLLTAGPRTNPWFRECGPNPIEKGDIVTFDTDLIGPYGYCADISRAFVCGGKATAEQQRLYGLAREQIEYNLALVRPGIGFRELSERSFALPENCQPNRYCVVFHGVGLCDEYPFGVYEQDFDASGYDGVVEAGMTLCFESYIGEVGGREGVKLEQQVLITETGYELLSHYPFDEALMPSRWV